MAVELELCKSLELTRCSTQARERLQLVDILNHDQYHFFGQFDEIEGLHHHILEAGRGRHGG